ncbi:MAG TPA: pyruvate kinase [Clostridiales bacterium]|nr:MAG: pyruvate kinase [Clostridiales bacterium GWD2_32_19]HCC08314.1 pyruvate kinase [Clostridiales bacterium]
MKKTKIVCTIGPATESKEMLVQLIKAGMNVVRLNMSHGTHEQHGEKVEKVKEVREKLKVPIAILLDTKGPEIRTHMMQDGSVILKTGQKMIISMDEVLGTNEKISVTYKNMAKDVNIGDKILIDDGLIEMVVLEKRDDEIVVEVKNDAVLLDRKSINMPATKLHFNFISEQDKSDIEWGLTQGIDFIAASFIRRPSDVLELKQLLKDNRAGHVKIISKIECQEGVQKFEEILALSDGIMVARGDLGVEVDMEELPSIQKMLIRRCNEVGKPVITATQMLESMKSNPRPTRAEVTDVANAIYDGTSAIMLSAESASGKYPIEAVEAMTRIALKTESLLEYNENFIDVSDSGSITEAISSAAADMAEILGAHAIIAMTKTGSTANKVSKYRNRCSLVAVTDVESTYRQLALTWGAIPALSDTKVTTDEMMNEGIIKALETGVVEIGAKVVITSGIVPHVSGATNMIKVHVIE